MAYNTSNSPGLIAQKNGSNGQALWAYHSNDAISLVVGAAYFSDGDSLGMRVGDLVLAFDDTNDTQRLLQVSAVVVDTGATVQDASLGAIEELTESGAVTPGVQFLDLNHATVVIEAAIANSLAHTGMFVVRNTSASGTAAHTLTLTTGTFDGSNNVATLNAPDEMLVVLFDGSGDGRIVQNTGAVALS